MTYAALARQRQMTSELTDDQHYREPGSGMDSATSMVSPLRILHVVESLELGGMERMVATLCREADPAVHEVSVLVTRKLGVLGEALLNDGFTVRCAGLRAVGTDYLAIGRIATQMRKFSPHVVHTHATHGLLYGGVAARWSGTSSWIHTEHGRIFPDKAHLMLAERWLSRSMARYVTVSQELAEFVHEFQRIPRSRIEVIPNGAADLPPADLARVRSLRRALIGERAGPVIGVVARLVWEKGLDVLLKAWAITKPRPHESGILIIAGEGPERAHLEQLIENLGLTQSVFLPGAVSDVASFYRMLDGFVLPSVSEGLPMALLEAMAAGLPIIATEVGGIPSAAPHGQAAVLVKPADVASLSGALSDLLIGLQKAEAAAPAHRWATLGRAARLRFEQTYTASAMAARYAALYSSKWSVN